MSKSDLVAALLIAAASILAGVVRTAWAVAIALVLVFVAVLIFLTDRGEKRKTSDWDHRHRDDAAPTMADLQRAFSDPEPPAILDPADALAAFLGDGVTERILTDTRTDASGRTIERMEARRSIAREADAGLANGEGKALDATARTLSIDAAIWRSVNGLERDVRDVLREQVRESRLDVPAVSDALTPGEDIDPGGAKSLEVTFTINGTQGSQRYDEGERVLLPPDGSRYSDYELRLLEELARRGRNTEFPASAADAIVLSRLIEDGLLVQRTADGMSFSPGLGAHQTPFYQLSEKGYEFGSRLGQTDDA